MSWARAVATRRGCGPLELLTVPVKKVDGDGEREAAARLPSPTLVLHSRADLVLALAFALGGTLAGDGFFPQAVGRDSAPGLAIWGQAPVSRTRFGHSDDWREQASAHQVRAYLGEAILRELPANVLIERELPLPARPTACRLPASD